MARKKIEQPQDAHENGGVSKTEAARTALAEGMESPQKAVPYIKNRFGIDMSPQHFSATKSLLRRREQGTATTVKKTVIRSGRPVGRPASSNGEGDLMAAMEAIKPLVASLGADKVKRIVDLLG